MIFPGKITAQGVALAPSRSDATGGSALDGDLDRQDNARRRWTGQPHSRGVSNCGPRGRVTAGHYRLGGSGDSRPASAAAPGSAPRARGRGTADAPGADDAATDAGTAKIRPEDEKDDPDER